MHLLPRRPRRRAHAAGRQRPAAASTWCSSRSRARAATSRATCIRSSPTSFDFVEHARLHARRAGSGDQDDQPVDPVHLSAGRGRRRRPEDPCRRPANPSEWQGTAAVADQGLLRRRRPAQRHVRGQLRAASAGSRRDSRTLYENVIAPSCRTCHIMRGSGGKSDIDFTTLREIRRLRRPHQDRTCMDRGNMPLAKIVYDAFWHDDRPGDAGDVPAAQGHNGARWRGRRAAARPPDRRPGPDRAWCRSGATTLSGADSLFASTYAWTLVSGPAGGATLTNADLGHADLHGHRRRHLRGAARDHGQRPHQQRRRRRRIVVSDDARPRPSAIRFADIKDDHADGAACTQLPQPRRAPCRARRSSTRNEDRNGDGTWAMRPTTSGSTTEVRSRINFTEIAASALLRKPSGNHHGGLLQSGFDTHHGAGRRRRARDFDLFQNWILNGAPLPVTPSERITKGGFGRPFSLATCEMKAGVRPRWALRPGAQRLGGAAVPVVAVQRRADCRGRMLCQQHFDGPLERSPSVARAVNDAVLVRNRQKKKARLRGPLTAACGAQ